MSHDDDDLEARLRSALTTPHSADRVDPDDFLSSVHRGARVRRVKRGVSVAAAAALVVAGGGLAINASGLLNSSQTPAANGPTGTTDVTGSPTGPTRSKVSPPPVGTGPVTIKAHGVIAADDVMPVSLTATGDDHQWVLAETPGGNGCSSTTCATIFVTGDHGSAWNDLGQLPARPATSDAPTSTSVSQLRFVKRNETTYDGWAYGNALWSTHDSGRTWSNAGSPAGDVTQLEAWGSYVYAGVSSPGEHQATLYRSPTTTDDWQPIAVGPGLTNVQSLAAAKGVEGLIDSGTGHSILYVSQVGVSWQPQTPCPAGTDPNSLSTASDSTGVGSLWVTCSSATTTVVRYMDTDHWGRWNSVSGSFGAGVMVAARTPTHAVAAGAGITGIESVSSGLARPSLYGLPVGAPVYFGFTNDRYGYLLDSLGHILSTTDGRHWAPYAVSRTTP